MGDGPQPVWLRMPSKRDASERRLRAQLDEQVLTLRVLHARARRRSADATIRLLDAVELARERLDFERRSAAETLARWKGKLERLVSRSD